MNWTLLLEVICVANVLTWTLAVGDEWYYRSIGKDSVEHKD